jgi:beta-glucosidase-like glycosyl hydrolase
MSARHVDLQAAHDLSLRDKIAQLIFVRIGSNMQPPRTVEQDEELVAHLLEECCFGGLALFNGGPETRPVLDRLQQRAAVPLLVGSDIERGVGQQVKGYTLFPHAMAFGKMPEREGDRAVERFAEVLAHEAWNAGIHITFGPVADVSTNPKNPIIATRAFHEDPERTAALVDRFVRRVQAYGLHATAKHFPGHGDTDLDSHATLPSVGKAIAELESCELLPFQAAINAGCRLIMTAHVAYPALDPSGTPATLSPLIVKKLLREEMEFDGVVCTDSLLMAGVRERFASEGEMALAALNAGVDLLLDVNDPLTVVDYLCQRVDDGQLEISQIDESLQRIWKLKATLPYSTRDGFACETVRSIARQAIRVVGQNRDSMTALDRDAPLGAILLTPFEAFAADVTEQPLAAALREQFRDVQYVQLGPQASTIAYDAARALAREAKQLLVAAVVRPAAWQAFGLRAEQSEFVRAILKQRQDVVLVSLGVPSILNEFPEAAFSICTYSDVPASQQAVVEFVLGRH